MSDLAKRYIRELYDSLRYWGTWAPGVEVDLGDCGPIDNWVFRPERNVRDFGIEFDPDPAPATSPWSHTSDGAVSVEFQGTAETQRIPNVPRGAAGIRLKFSRKNAIVFAAVDGRHSRVVDIFDLKRQIVGKAQGGEFPEYYVVVTEVVTARSATVLLSESDEGEFVASASADFRAGIVDLGNASLNVTQRSQRNVRTEILARTSVTPLFNAFKLDRDWFGRIRVDALDDRMTVEQDLPFSDLTPETADEAQAVG
ncbi:MAG: hypothetical protein ACRDRG_19235 [Pseudonocardiaceae bacterium]